MKQKRRICRRVLPSLMLLAVALSCAFTGKAQITYRGFVEGGLGMNWQYEYDNVNFSYMVATTHGVQFKNNFIGLGLGIIPGYCESDFDNYYSYETTESKISVPFYANWRYDFFNLDKTLKPYVGIKAGYYLPISEFFKSSYGFPLYTALDFGLRKRISDTSGLSFGIAVQTSNGAYDYYAYNGFGLNFLAKVAFDF